MTLVHMGFLLVLNSFVVMVVVWNCASRLLGSALLSAVLAGWHELSENSLKTWPCA